jgi:outer membrane immunogenic protein
VTLAAARETLGTRALGLRTWQLSPIWVVGLEADLQGALEKESSTVTNNFQFTIGNPPSGGVTGTAVAQYTAKIDWFGTVRLRAGYAWGNGDVLSYVTGGLAYCKVDLEGTNTVSGTVDGSLFSIAQTFGHSHVNTGWVVGTGTEGKLLIPGWTYKIETLYMDLGHLDARGVTSGVSFNGPPEAVVSPL